MGLHTDFKKKMKQTELHLRHLIKVEVPVNSLHLNITNTINAGTKVHKHEQKEEDLTTTLSPSSLLPVSFKKETIKGHTPMMLATTSTRWGILKSLVRMTFSRAGPEDIQSRDSAPFSRLTMNSVLASPSKLPNTLETVRCKHLLNTRRSENG